MTEYTPDNPITSPTLPTNEGIVHTPKQFSDSLTLDLTDDEIARAMQITLPIKAKYERIFRYRISPHGGFTVEQAMKLLDQFEDELKTKLAEELDLLVSVDVAPVFEGQPPVIEFLGALPSHYSAKHGADHERKAWEVRRAKERGEDFLGSGNLE